MRQFVAAMLVAVAVIHLLPVAGVLGDAQLGALYGIAIAEPNLSILMRHRAMLFAILGMFLLLAAFRPSWQWPAIGAGLASVMSFLWLAIATGGYNAPIARVVTADVVALVCLLLAAVLRLHLSRQDRR